MTVFFIFPTPAIAIFHPQARLAATAEVLQHTKADVRALPFF